jgi:hypothetical protein
MSRDIYFYKKCHDSWPALDCARGMRYWVVTYVWEVWGMNSVRYEVWIERYEVWIVTWIIRYALYVKGVWCEVQRCCTSFLSTTGLHDPLCFPKRFFFFSKIIQWVQTCPLRRSIPRTLGPPAWVSRLWVCLSVYLCVRERDRETELSRISRIAPKYN